MNLRHVLNATAAALFVAALTPASAQQVGKTEIGGVVTGPSGPEAGVWVIAETSDLPTKFTKIVVTDDQGRYMIPEMPKAKYKVWVRGYGLVDSPKVDGEPGKKLNLKAVKAPDEKSAAEYYPPIYWYAMLKIPKKEDFPLEKVKSQPAWLNDIKTSGCMSCHALGTKGTRTMPKEFSDMTPADAWARRIQSGQAMTQMVTVAGRLDTQKALDLWGDWTTRVAQGELPFEKPERPKGIERNVVLTMWDWSSPKHYMHDLISTDRNNPSVNANGLIYGATEESTPNFPWLDPKNHKVGTVHHPVRDPKTPNSKDAPMAASPFWGPDPIWENQTSIHNQMMDEKGRVWSAARVRPPANPDWCKAGSDHPSAKVFPVANSGRHLSLYDPKTGKFSLISTCFQTHHVIVANDKNRTVWASSGVTGPGVIGWLNQKMYEETGDEQKSQGWTPFILDTNGNGKRDEHTNPNQPNDAAKDRRVHVSFYSVMHNPTDGSIWGTSMGFPGHVVRLVPGADPTHTAITEIYEVPSPGYGPRGGDVGTDGIFWSSLASGHLGKFDRSKCKVTNGPTATGAHCPEGWTLYKMPGPQFRDVKDDGSAEASYYTWVDWYNTFGLGKNVPIVSANMQGGYAAFVNGKWVNLRVPYPMNFFPKWADGRIDNAKTGWKGRALWSANATRTVFHVEGGTENLPKVVKFQMRPDPLAK